MIEYLQNYGGYNLNGLTIQEKKELEHLRVELKKYRQIEEQEEEYERENNKRQIDLYNEYLQLKKEREENNKEDLPSFLPVLVSRPNNKDSYHYDDEDDDHGRQQDGKKNTHFKRRIYSRPPLQKRRIRVIGSYGKKYFGNKRRGGGYIGRFRGRRYKKGYYS